MDNIITGEFKYKVITVLLTVSNGDCLTRDDIACKRK